MPETTNLSKPQSSVGDIAVDGIFTGIEAGIVMAFFLVALSASQGMPPRQVLAAFSINTSNSWITGLLTHLAVSIVYGILFSVSFFFLNRGNLLIKSRLAGIFVGLVYGFFLWLVAEYFLFDFTTTLLKKLPSVILLTGHLFYGLTLGLLVQRRQLSTFG